VPTAGDIPVRSLSAGARNFIDVRRFVGLQQAQDSLFERREPLGLGIEMRRNCPRIQARWAESKLSHKFCWKFFPYVFPGRHQHGALLDEGVRSPGISVGDVAGHRKHVAILFERTACGDARGGYSAASTTTTPTDIPPMIRLAMGKFCEGANVPRGNSEIRALPSARICSESGEFSWR
jgi:hypothetical protein